MSLMMISFVFVMLTMTKASMDRIFEALDTNIDVEEPEYPITVDKVYGEVEFDHVHFSYGKQQDEEVLSDISFKIKPGEVFWDYRANRFREIFSLYSWFLDSMTPHAGTVRVGGHDVREYRFADLRQNVSMVLQKNTLFLWNNSWEPLMGKSRRYRRRDDASGETRPSSWLYYGNARWIWHSCEQGGSNFSGGQNNVLQLHVRCYENQPC